MISVRCRWFWLDGPPPPRPATSSPGGPACPPTPRRSGHPPDELVVVEEGGVLDYAQAFLHSVDEGLDLQVGHFIQREEADAPEDVQQVARLQVQRLQVLREDRARRFPVSARSAAPSGTGKPAALIGSAAPPRTSQQHHDGPVGLNSVPASKEFTHAGQCVPGTVF